MKKKIIKIINHPLISGSSIVFVGSFIGNIFNYLFNLSAGRLLNVSDYGLLISLTSITALFGVLQTMIASIFAKYAAVGVANENRQELAKILRYGMRKTVILSGGIFVVMLLGIPFLMSFLHVQNISLLFLTILSIALSILFAFPLGVLQGEMRFYTFTFLTNLHPLLKLFFGGLFIIIGFRVFGALLGIVLALIVPLAIAFIFLRKQIGEFLTAENIDQKASQAVFSYGKGLFLTSIGITLLSNTDIVMVRHFFTPILAGQYAALSLMGKAIYYFISPINFVLFPLIAFKREKKERLLHTLLLAFGIIIIFAGSISAFYFLFPGFVVKIFFPAKAYASLVNYLGLYSLYIIAFSVLSIFNNFFLSLGRTGIYKFTLTAALLQIILISIFHQSLFQVILLLILVSLALFSVFLLYYMYYERD